MQLAKGKKLTRNDIIFTRRSNIPTLVEQLQNCYDEYRKKKVLEKQTEHIIIDEYDINSYQSTYRKELAKIYVESMTKSFTILFYRSDVLAVSLKNLINSPTNYPYLVI